MHVLLTGTSGFFGSVCAQILAHQNNITLYALRSGERSANVYCVSRAFSAPTSLSPTDLATTLDGVPISHIIHIGALASPEVCERDPQRAWVSNVNFTEMLSGYASLTNAHLTTISTDLVFDGARAPSAGFSHDAPTAPSSVYSRSKVAAEETTLRTDFGAVVRVALLYGQSPSASKGFLGWMRQTFSEGDPVPLFDDEYRTPIHVTDAARFVSEVSRLKLRGIWHCGGPERVSRVDFGTRVARTFGFDEGLIRATSRLSHVTPPTRPEDVSLNSEALWKTVGFKPKPVEEALLSFDTP